MRSLLPYLSEKLLRRCVPYFRTTRRSCCEDAVVTFVLGAEKFETMLPMQGKNLDSGAARRQALETTSK